MSRGRKAAFTLVELLVAIAIIAILIAIVVPSLSGARDSARTIACAANARSMAQGIAAYATGYRERMPPAYVAADITTPQLAWDTQLSEGADRPIIHWTRMVFGSELEVHDKSFRCPAAPDGGAPSARATETAREMWQRAAAPPPDWQPDRMAYTVNGALMPPGTFLQHWPRASRLVGVQEVSRPESTVLATEFYHDARVGWRAIAEDNQYSRSHRPIMPFIGGSTGAYLVFDEPNIGTQPRFFYPTNGSIFTVDQLARINQLFGVMNVITSNAVSSLNAVGRSHPGPGSVNAADGGSANFAMADGHVERTRVRDTLKRRLWGDRFLGISGGNSVHPTEQADP